LEIGRKLFRLLTFVSFFFFVKAAVLNVAGTTPVQRVLFIMVRTIGHKIAKHDWNRQVGTGSTVEVAGFIFETSLQRAFSKKNKK